ncbi:hypothetical protein TOPH_05739 [Tolypocladium ophioglossoides CBS 100239]|uniref:Uncharacterized protein n=1 Tax=Tolypocladium ophioglossoides (strain CBS 100239) TaxID=1163406 RepID=A0A0L0N710_TOLOC|nr:hypothetical protein TOPH_05739 [Tolypocladium ophioglossoides CBS 100239]
MEAWHHCVWQARHEGDDFLGQRSSGLVSISSTSSSCIYIPLQHLHNQFILYSIQTSNTNISSNKDNYNTSTKHQKTAMFSGRKTRHHNHTTTTTTSHPPRRHGIFSRRHAAPVHHQKRKPTMKDKISGAFTKLRGSLTGRPGLKAAGTRRMHGTDGRGSHRRRRFF